MVFPATQSQAGLLPILDSVIGGIAPGGGKASPLRFGIYPGGGIGSVNPVLKARPEDPEKIISSLQDLRQGGPFVVRIYREYNSDADAGKDNTGLADEIRRYGDAGLDVEIVARFRPGGNGASVSGFSEYLRNLIRNYGGNPRFVRLQVTNEANVAGSPEASDGAYPAAVSALVRGVAAAGEEVRSTGSKVEVGFNWAHESSKARQRSFWKDVAAAAGPDFAGSVDWVGLNSYPGTWSPLQRGLRSRSARAGRTLVNHLVTLRRELMPIAGLGRGVSIEVAETGWPTGPGRSAPSQAAILNGMVGAVARSARTLNVTDFRWFDLRDSNSADPNFEGRYGLTGDAYEPKPAYFAYRRAIQRWGRNAGN